ISDKVTYSCSGTLHLRFTLQVNYENIKCLFLWRRICAEPLVALDVLFKGVLDVGCIPTVRFRFVDVIDKVAREVPEASAVEGKRKCLFDESTGLVPIHLASNRYEERRTSRGLSACGL